MFTTMILLSSLSADTSPQYTVVNRCPTTYTVVNKVPPTIIVNRVPLEAPKKISSPLYTDIHAGHDCPSCGRSQYVVNRQQGNLHSHKCNSCGTEWWHSTGGISTLSQEPIFNSSGCSGPGCSTSSSQTYRGGLFRSLRR